MLPRRATVAQNLAFVLSILASVAQTHAPFPRVLCRGKMWIVPSSEPGFFCTDCNLCVSLRFISVANTPLKRKDLSWLMVSA